MRAQMQQIRLDSDLWAECCSDMTEKLLWKQCALQTVERADNVVGG